MDNPLVILRGEFRKSNQAKNPDVKPRRFTGTNLPHLLGVAFDLSGIPVLSENDDSDL